MARLSYGLMIGAGWVAKAGLGAKPLRALLLANIVMWPIGISFTIRENIWLASVGLLAYRALIPVAEAAEQIVLCRRWCRTRSRTGVRPRPERRGGCRTDHSLLTGPIAQFWLIPYADSGAGQQGPNRLLGEGEARGIALVFVLAGFVRLVLTLGAFLTRSYRLLSQGYSVGEPAVETAG